jgi:aspartyl-tRNA(Asn)/glutamyl-tRNA(Gln) amidotransferase subunit A
VKDKVPEYVKELDSWESKDLKGIRFGIPKDLMSGGLEDSVSTSFNEVINKLVKLGAEIVEISLPHASSSLAAYYITAPAEATSNLARFDGIRYGHRSASYHSLQELYEKSRAEGFGKEVKRRIMIGSFVLSSGYYDAYYKKAQQIRTLVINDYKAAFMNSCDIVLTPVSPTVAFKLGEKTSASPLTMYLADIFTVPINLAGLPGISIPTSLSPEKLPIGMQCVGPLFSESLLLGVASVFEREFKFPVTQRTTGRIN